MNGKDMGGVVNERESKERHLRLESYLLKVRELFGDVWERYELVQPETARFSEGLHTTTVNRLMGSRTPFVKTEVVTTEPLEDKRLHMIGIEERRASKLMPFITIDASPSSAQNTCYFYNRFQKDGLKFVTHHHAEQSETVNEDSVIKSMVEMFSK